MNNTLWQVTYRDCHGSEAITFSSDGSQLQTVIRDIAFSGESFDSLTAAQASHLVNLTVDDKLCNCRLDIAVPTRLLAPDGLRIAELVFNLPLGQPDANGRLPQLKTRLSMQQPEFHIAISSETNYIESLLLDLIKQLPPAFKLENCITCGLSDYHPFGSGFFGDMACFRRYKEAYRQVKDKAALFDLWWGDVTPVTTQETYYCAEYEERPLNHGYRG